MMSGGCGFCEEYTDSRNSEYYRLLGHKIGITSRIVYETKHWYVVPTLGCLVPGYILLVCKNHYLSTANLSKDLYCEFIELKKEMESIIYKQVGLPCICFEHGVTSELYSGANSVNHVHIHIVPYSNSIWHDMSQKYNLNSFAKVANYENLYTMWLEAKPKSYLLFQDTDSAIYYKDDASGFPSQFFRMCMASYLNVKQWDWKIEYYEENITKTIRYFRK